MDFEIYQSAFLAVFGSYLTFFILLFTVSHAISLLRD